MELEPTGAIVHLYWKAGWFLAANPGIRAWWNRNPASVWLDGTKVATIASGGG